ncbi:YtxH domain-containing protein [Fodinibius sp. Rm-B-1B1-1]|uniref:YtxH domain-containing protein n=1 Tax=Fodinibius alkaliphilus TaxID=3140241 RepID=UPI00315B1A4D
MDNSKFDKLLIATLSGLAGGVVVGMLFAPDKGTKTREKISQKGEEYLETIRNDLAEIRAYLQRRAEATKKEFDELSEQTKNKSEEVLKKAKKLTSFEEWTKEELYERAKKEKIEGYSQMNKEELIEALKEKRGLPMS